MPAPITVPIFQNRPLTALPDQMPDVADLQRKSALANALMSQAVSPIQGQPVGSGPYSIVPKTGLATGISQIGSALLARNLNKQIQQEQRTLSDQYAAQLRAMFGGGTSGVSAPAPASQAPQATISPQGPYAGGLNQPPPQAAPAPSQQAPSGNVGTASPMNPAGLNPDMAAMLYATDPKSYVEGFVAPYYKPADIIGKLRAAGIDPGSPLAQQIAQTNIAKENYIAPINAREGSTILDPFNPSRPLFEAPKEGVGLQYTPQGPVAYEVPGYRQARAGITGAETGAKELNTPRVLPTPSGGSQFVYPSQVAGMPPALGGSYNQPTGAAGGGAPPAPTSAIPNGEAPVWSSMPKLNIPTGTGAPGTYTDAVFKGMAEKRNELATKYGQEADLADQKIALNREALKDLDKAELGPLSEKLTEYRGMLKELGVPDSLIGGDKVAPTQQLKKYLVNNAIQGARQIYGNRMTESEVMLQKDQANPSDKMTLLAVKELIKFQNIQNEYSRKRAQDFDKYVQYGGDPLRFESWYTAKFPLSEFVTPPSRAEIEAEMKRRGIKPNG